MKNPKISIIIPVYNLENYIYECLNSVKEQTYSDYEVILINDGSTDRSEEIIRSFIETYSLKNFFLINKENGGLARARNTALQYACGEWVTFIDGDDWVEPHYLSSMIEALEAYPADLCYAGYQAYDENSKTVEVWSRFGDGAGVMPQDIGKLYSFGYVWAHFYKRELIEKYELRFDDRIYCEDAAFNLDYNSVIKSFCMTGEVVYNYRINRNGQLTKKMVHPREKRVLYDHMQMFLASVDEETVLLALPKNERFCRIMWNELYASVTNDILEKQYGKVRSRKKSAVTRIIMKEYHPRSRKEKLFITFMKLPLCFLIVLVKTYYGNYEKLRQGKLVRFLSKNN